MAKFLLIAEKPSVAVGSYAKLLEEVENESFQRKNGYLEGQKWRITWCVGHLVELAMPEAYGWKDWSLETIPMIPEEWKYDVKEATKDQFEVIRNLLKTTSMVLNGTDAGREGELIFRYVMEVASEGRIINEQRLWLNSFVQEDMVKAWDKRKSGEEMLPLANAAKARSVSDWLVGMNLTRGYSVFTGVRGLSVGRVQTPTLGLIVKRDHEVESWVEKFFYELVATWKGMQFIYFKGDQREFENESELSVVKESIEGKDLLVGSVEETEKKKNPSRPFDLEALQKLANKELGYSSADTLKIAQSLYEKKLITYPRTDSSYLPETMREEAFELLEKLKSGKESSWFKIDTDNLAFFNNSKVTDHFAIIPTSHVAEDLVGKEKEIYDRVVQRFVTAFGKPFRYNETVVEAKIDEHRFQAKSKVVVDKGWTQIYGVNEDESEGAVEVPLSLKEGETLSPEQSEIVKRKRSKPKYYTEDTLLTAMSTAGKTLENEELQDAMKERGLGTPATKAATIETLKKRQYIEMKGKNLISTTKGRELIKLVDESISSAEMTGEWEYKLRELEAGRFSYADFMGEIEAYVKRICERFEGQNEEFKKLIREEHEDCPNCGSGLRYNKGGVFCESCGFKIWRKKGDKLLSDSNLKDLITKGKTSLVKGFVSQNKKTFDAKVVLEDKTTGKTKYEFTERRK